MSPAQAAAPERVTHAALVIGGVIWQLPAPARHHHVLQALNNVHRRDDGRLPGTLRVPQEDFGFVTSKGRFVNRLEAKEIAERAGQLLNGTGRSHGLPELYSEDVW